MLQSATCSELPCCQGTRAAVWVSWGGRGCCAAPERQCGLKRPAEKRSPTLPHTHVCLGGSVDRGRCKNKKGCSGRFNIDTSVPALGSARQGGRQPHGAGPMPSRHPGPKSWHGHGARQRLKGAVWGRAWNCRLQGTVSILLCAGCCTKEQVSGAAEGGVRECTCTI